MRLTYQERIELADLARRLEERNERFLTCVNSVQLHDGREFRVVDPDTQHVICAVPVKDVRTDDVGAWFLSQLEMYCSLCQVALLAGEEGVCGVCESTEVMGLLRVLGDLT